MKQRMTLMKAVMKKFYENASMNCIASFALILPIVYFFLIKFSAALKLCRKFNDTDK